MRNRLSSFIFICQQVTGKGKVKVESINGSNVTWILTKGEPNKRNERKRILIIRWWWRFHHLRCGWYPFRQLFDARDGNRVVKRQNWIHSRCYNGSDLCSIRISSECHSNLSIAEKGIGPRSAQSLSPRISSYKSCAHFDVRVNHTTRSIQLQYEFINQLDSSTFSSITSIRSSKTSRNSRRRFRQL